MPHRRTAAVAAVAAVLVSLSLACSDGTGPDGTSEHPLVILRGTSFRTVWVYTGTRSRRVTPEGVNVIYDVAVAPDGRLAFSTIVGSAPRFGIVETTGDGRHLRTIDTGPIASTTEPARALAYAPDGGRLAWRTRRGPTSDSLLVLDAGSTAPRGLAVGAVSPDRLMPHLQWTANGRIAFALASAVVTVGAASGDTTTVFANGDALLDFDFASDGRLAVATIPVGADRGRLLVQRVTGGPLDPLAPVPGADRFMVRWSPDGRRLATTTSDSTYVSPTWRPRWLPDVLTLAGASQRPRTGDVDLSRLVGWTRDGRIVFIGGIPVNNPPWIPDVYTALPGGGTVNVTSTPGEFEELVVIPR